MTSEPTTPKKPEQEKLEKDIQNILSFGALFVTVTVVLWAAYTLAAPFWHLPSANYFNVLGTCVLAYAARKTFDSFRK